jgi:ankyrin repeat protein
LIYLFIYLSLSLTNIDGVSCLQLASHHGNLDIINIILKAGGRVDIMNNELETPLFYAVAGNHPNCVRALLDAKATVNHVV